MSSSTKEPPPGPAPSVTLSIVNWNAGEYLRRCLQILERARRESALPLEVIVIENASGDGSAAMVRSEFPWAVLIENPANVGYGPAHNQAFARSTGRYFLILNSDLEIDAKAIETMALYLESHPEAAMAVPYHRFPDGTLLPPISYGEPGFRDLLVMSSGLGPLLTRLKALGWYRRLWAGAHGGRIAEPVEADWMGGACMMVRRDAFERAGRFDEAIFLYREDTDISIRLRRLGLKLMLVPRAEILHHWGKSSVQADPRTRAKYVLSHWRYFRKYSPAWQVPLRWLVFTGGAAANAGAFALAGACGRRKGREGLETYGWVLRRMLGGDPP